MSAAIAAASSDDRAATSTATAAAAAAATGTAVPPPMLLLSESTVMAALTMADAIHINAQAFLAVSATEQSQVPAYASIRTPVAPQSQQSQSQSESQPQQQQQQQPQQPVPVPDDATLFKPALLDEALGIKVVAIRPSNDALSLPTVPAVVLLHDRATGFPTALVQATHLTALRTAAGSAVATECFARPDAAVLAVFGAGLQADQHVRAMLCVRDIRTVHIVNRSAGRALGLVARLRPDYPAVEFIVHSLTDSSSDPTGPASSALSAALRSSHVICTTTNSSTPLLRLADVSPGTHINAVGSFQAHMHELDAPLVAACRIVVDCPAALHSGDLLTPAQRGLIRTDGIRQLGCFIDRQKYAHVLRDDQRGDIGFDLRLDLTAPMEVLRTSADDRTLFKSVGSAIQDVSTSFAVLQRARAQKTGKTAQWQ